MTKVSIIDVQLDLSINEIISKDVAELTGKSKQILDDAITTQKAIKEQKDQKEAAKKENEDEISSTLDKIYTTIEESKDDGIPVDEVMKIGEGTIPNTSALTLRLKTLLRSKGNPYRLERKKRHNVARYYFKPFNQTDDPS